MADLKLDFEFLKTKLCVAFHEACVHISEIPIPFMLEEFIYKSLLHIWIHSYADI